MQRLDFAAEIRRNRRNSFVLVLAFIALLGVLGYAIAESHGFGLYGAAGAVAFGGLYSGIAFATGDRMVLSLAGAKAADPDEDRELINIVDEMRIAAGLPMPKVFVMDTPAMNAFATGRSPQGAAVTVTRGLADKLRREELQAVVGHELGHIRNYDIRYMMLVAALAGAIVMISDFYLRTMRFGGGNRRRGGKASGAFAIVAIALAILAPVFSTLLQMAVSRKREYLADASAVEFTRNPNALASALEKLSDAVKGEPLKVASRATQHLYIVNPLRTFGARATALLSTHPPTTERIARLRAMTAEYAYSDSRK